MTRDADTEASRFDLDNFWADQSAVPEQAGSIDWEVQEVREARVKDRVGREIQVLVLVKTMPQLSAKYNDTVCVAGLALNPLRWVRLYPVPFRYLAQRNQFAKYTLIKVKVRLSNGDPRFESLKIDASSIRVEDTLDSREGWKLRARYVEPIGEVSLCQLRRNIDDDDNGPSLGLVRPQRGSVRLIMKDTPPETDKQAKKRRRILTRQELDLGGASMDQGLVKLAEPPRLSGWFGFTCAGEPECTGHRLGFIDWEFAALQHNNKALDIEGLKELLVDKFETNPTKLGKDLRFFVGNLHDKVKRSAFQILGLYYPSIEAVSDEQNCLFSSL